MGFVTYSFASVAHQRRTGQGFTTAPQAYRLDVDVSDFDFGPAELTELLIKLASVAKVIDVEPRLHQEDEMARTAEGSVPLHEGLSGPTFRIRCLLRSGDRVIEQFAALAAGLGVSSVFDHDGWVRLRHERVDVAAS